MNRMHRSFQIREVSADGRNFTAVAMKYDTVDSYDTVFAAGCFARSLKEHLPRITWAHDWSRVTGRVISYEDTPEQLIVHARLSDPEAVPDAKQAIAQLRDGDVEDVSVGFSVRESRKEDGTTIFEDCDLDEVAIGLVRGAVPGAKVLAVRSVQPRRSRVISEDVGLSIVSAAIQAVQGGATATDAIKAALADIESNSVDQTDEELTEAKPTEETEAKPVEETEAEKTEETTEAEPVVTEETAETTEVVVEQEPVETETAQDALETETEQVEQEAPVESADAELDALFAEVDSLMADTDNSWAVPSMTEPVTEVANG